MKVFTKFFQKKYIQSSLKTKPYFIFNKGFSAKIEEKVNSIKSESNNNLKQTFSTLLSNKQYKEIIELFQITPFKQRKFSFYFANEVSQIEKSKNEVYLSFGIQRLIEDIIEEMNKPEVINDNKEMKEILDYLVKNKINFILHFEPESAIKNKLEILRIFSSIITLPKDQQSEEIKNSSVKLYSLFNEIKVENVINIEDSSLDKKSKKSFFSVSLLFKMLIIGSLGYLYYYFFYNARLYEDYSFVKNINDYLSSLFKSQNDRFEMREEGVTFDNDDYSSNSNSKSASSSNTNNNFTPKFKKSTDVSKFELTFAKDMKERLSDVKGIKEVQEEIELLIQMIKNPKKYTDVGAKVHKGVLLCGRPGTGKTLLARAIAGESNINFLFVTGSDFDDTYVGVGSKRIRELFKKARESKPCIIFIDEIDSLLDKSRRGSYEHSSSRSTLNQFLAEMDGFKNSEEIYVIGATNHENSLDTAAVRPGRFDKIIHIGVPDIEGREEIISYYLDKIKLKRDTLTTKVISLMTPGFTGAEIQNLINLSIISAVNQQKSEVDISDVSESRDRLLMGIARKSFSVPEKRRYKTALHEAGHALVCFKDELCRKTLHKLTVVPRGPAEGVTFRMQDENSLNTKQEYLVNIDVAMGGQVAEELMYGPEGISAGCSSDLESATSLARSMIKNYGMYGSTVGYQYINNQSYSYEEDEVSEKHKKVIDDEVNKILKESHDRVYKLLYNNADELKSLAEQCYIHDTLEFEEIQGAIEGKLHMIKAKKVREPLKDKNIKVTLNI